MVTHKGQQGAIVEEFSHQAESFNRSPVMTSAQTLTALVESLPARPDQRWLEVACGPGLVARSLAPRVREVVAADLTPRMLELGRREALSAGLRNVRFTEADATALPFAAGEFDGAVIRFALHHIPLPDRVLAEMARAVRPGGWVAVQEHLAGSDRERSHLQESMERLRDPSHWACLTDAWIRRHGRASGLRLLRRRDEPFHLDLDEWLERGSTGRANQNLIETVLERLGGDPFCALLPGRVLRFRLGRYLWRKGPG